MNKMSINIVVCSIQKSSYRLANVIATTIKSSQYLYINKQTLKKTTNICLLITAPKVAEQSTVMITSDSI